MINIRAHHINCLFFYIGKGYSNEFIEKMDFVRNEFINDSRKKFMLVNKCDEICDVCPNKLTDNTCETNDHVLELDKKTIEEYKLNINKIYDFKYIKDNIYLNFDDTKFINICKECTWYKEGVCNIKSIEIQKEKWVNEN